MPDGSAIVTGFFGHTDSGLHLGGSATFGDGEPNETTFTSDGSDDVFLAKYASDGMLVWAKRAGGTADDEPCAVACTCIGGICHAWIEYNACYTACTNLAVRE